MENAAITVSWSEIIAGYAAILSTFLAVRSWYVSRFRILADMNISETYEIHITNLSPKPIIVYKYEFYWGNKRLNWDAYEIDFGGYYSVPSQSFRTITIEEQFMFSLKNDENLYIKLYVKGRKRPKRLLLR